MSPPQRSPAGKPADAAAVSAAAASVDWTAVRLARDLNQAAAETVRRTARHAEPDACLLRRLERCAHRYAAHVHADPVEALSDAWIAAASRADLLAPTPHSPPPSSAHDPAF